MRNTFLAISICIFGNFMTNLGHASGFAKTDCECRDLEGNFLEEPGGKNKGSDSHVTVKYSVKSYKDPNKGRAYVVGMAAMMCRMKHTDIKVSATCGDI